MSALSRTPDRVINSMAPIRVCDNGGWTDTWFARRGKVFSIAVAPYVEVQVRVYAHGGERERITIAAENYGDRYTISEPDGHYDKHPLIEAAMDLARIPKDVAIEVSIYSEAPPGCSTGTSASVSVALLGALFRLNGSAASQHDVAMAAFHVERELLGQQCGVQDQVAAAHGGINFIEMTEYPQTAVHRLPISDTLVWEMEQRLILIYVGNSHSSSDVHRMVIRELERVGMDSPHLDRLRQCATWARDALCRGDLEELGRAMVENTGVQEELHAELLGPHHREVIEVAREYGASGWKVNGAGGTGGSVAILSNADHSRKREMVQAILAANPKYGHIPVTLCRHGLRVWESPPRNGAGTRRSAADLATA